MWRLDRWARSITQQDSQRCVDENVDDCECEYAYHYEQSHECECEYTVVNIEMDIELNLNTAACCVCPFVGAAGLPIWPQCKQCQA